MSCNGCRRHPFTYALPSSAAGSIGTQALDVCKQHSDKLEVVALSAHSRTENLVHLHTSLLCDMWSR
ncbi:MAG: hypothetical protein ACLTKG_04550 [Collinsella intestinalis]